MDMDMDVYTVVIALPYVWHIAWIQLLILGLVSWTYALVLLYIYTLRWVISACCFIYPLPLDRLCLRIICLLPAPDPCPRLDYICLWILIPGGTCRAPASLSPFYTLEHMPWTPALPCPARQHNPLYGQFYV